MAKRPIEVPDLTAYTDQGIALALLRLGAPRFARIMEKARDIAVDTARENVAVNAGDVAAAFVRELLSPRPR